MSASRAAFLRAICENPDDDTPRLVFADWLDENDESDRAEFIRLQVGLAAGTVPEDRRGEAQARVQELLGRNEKAWLGELPHPSGVKWMPFDRGFVGGVRFGHGKAWREHSAEVFDAAPVERLACGGSFTEKTGRPVLASPLLGRVADFSGPPLDLAGAEALANNPHLVGRLRHLQACGSRGDADAVVAVLSRAVGLRNLESFMPGRVGPAGVAAIAGSPHLARLKSLHLQCNPVGDDGAEALAASPHLSALEYVLLNYAGVGDTGAAALARSERLASLRRLYLGGSNPITDAGALAIAASSGLPRLAELHLWGSRVEETGARALLKFAERRGLRVLNLGSCPIPADLAREIAERFGVR